MKLKKWTYFREPYIEDKAEKENINVQRRCRRGSYINIFIHINVLVILDLSYRSNTKTDRQRIGNHKINQHVLADQPFY